MKTSLLIILLSFCGIALNAAHAQSDYTCENINQQGNDPILPSTMTVSIMSKAEATMELELLDQKKYYENIVVSEEKQGVDHLIILEHDNFSLIISIAEKPYQAALNPLIIDGKSYGPYYFVCSKN